MTTKVIVVCTSKEHDHNGFIAGKIEMNTAFAVNLTGVPPENAVDLLKEHTQRAHPDNIIQGTYFFDNDQTQS